LREGTEVTDSTRRHRAAEIHREILDHPLAPRLSVSV
jgi:hypothetical protein